MNAKIQKLIEEAGARMKLSNDPAHGVDHARQVATYVDMLAKESNLSEEDHCVLILAAWWHDVGRTLTKKPSLVWMPLLDDILSAVMLWMATIRHGVFGSIAGKSTRLIFCKSLGTGAVLTRLLIRKKDRLLVNLLKDADGLELLNYERFAKIMPLVETSIIYHMSYKTMIRWFVSTKQLHMKTQAARKYILKLLRAFIEWAKQLHIFDWHVAQFGRAWYEAMVKKSEILLTKIEQRYLAGSLPSRI